MRIIKDGRTNMTKGQIGRIGQICQNKYFLGEHSRRWTDENDENDKNDKNDEFVKIDIFLVSIVEDGWTKMTKMTNLSKKDIF